MVDEDEDDHQNLTHVDKSAKTAQVDDILQHHAAISEDNPSVSVFIPANNEEEEEEEDQGEHEKTLVQDTLPLKAADLAADHNKSFLRQPSTAVSSLAQLSSLEVLHYSRKSSSLNPSQSILASFHGGGDNTSRIFANPIIVTTPAAANNNQNVVEQPEKDDDGIEIEQQMTTIAFDIVPPSSSFHKGFGGGDSSTSSSSSILQLSSKNSFSLSSSTSTMIVKKVDKGWTAWRKKYLPSDIRQIRYAIQVGVTMAITMLPMFIDDWGSKYFDDQASWICISAAVVVDASVGASIIKCLDRIIGTAIAAAITCSQLAVVTSVWTESDEFSKIKWTMYCLELVNVFIFGYIKFRFPKRPLIPSYGVTASIVFLSVLIKNMDVLRAAAFRVANVMLGVTITAIVVSLVLPNSARSTLESGLVKTLTKMADTLEPLVELELGMVPVKQMAARDPLKSLHKKSLAQQTSKIFRRSRGGTEHQPRISVAHVEGVKVEDWREFTAFRDTMWQNLSECWALLSTQMSTILAARHEWSLHHYPHTFHSKEHVKAYEDIRTMYFHIVSLFASLDDRHSSMDIMRQGSKVFLEDPATKNPSFDKKFRTSTSFFSKFEEIEENRIKSHGVLRASQLWPQSSFHSGRGGGGHTDDDSLSENVVADDKGFLKVPGAVSGFSRPSSTSFQPRRSVLEGPLLLTHSVSKQFTESPPLALGEAELELLQSNCHPVVTFTAECMPFVTQIVKGVVDTSRLLAESIKEGHLSTETSTELGRLQESLETYFDWSALKGQSLVLFLEAAAYKRLDEEPDAIKGLEIWLGLDISHYKKWNKETRKLFWASYWSMRQRIIVTSHTLSILQQSVDNAASSIETLLAFAKHAQRMEDEYWINRVERTLFPCLESIKKRFRRKEKEALINEKPEHPDHFQEEDLEDLANLNKL